MHEGRASKHLPAETEGHVYFSGVPMTYHPRDRVRVIELDAPGWVVGDLGELVTVDLVDGDRISVTPVMLEHLD